MSLPRPCAGVILSATARRIQTRIVILEGRRPDRIQAILASALAGAFYILYFEK